MKRKTIDVGSNPARYLGTSYSKCMYFFREDGRPMITIHLIFITIWLRIPIRHVTEFGHGSAVESYGFVVSLRSFYHHINFGFKTIRLFGRLKDKRNI